MKKLLLLLLLPLFASVAFGVITDYTFAEGTSTYTALTTYTVSTATGDDGSQLITLPFTFTYDEVAYTTLGVTTNGYVQFGTSSGGYTNDMATTTYKPIAAPLWDDLYDTATSEVRYATLGSGTTQEFVVEWYGILWQLSGGTAQYFQVHLYQTTNVIKFVYGTMLTPVGSPGASIGINDATGGSAHFRSITPGSPSTVSSVTANNAILAITYLPVGKYYTFTPPVAGVVPNPAVLVYPTPTGVGGIPITPTLSWASGGGSPTSYDVYWNGAASPVNQPGATYAPGTLAYSTTYSWKIVPRNAIGPAINCPTWTFTTMANPTITAFPYTENFDTVTAPALPLNWSATEGVAGAGYHWATATTAAHGPAAPLSAPNFAWLYCYLAQTTYNNYFLNTPPIALPAVPKRLVYSYWIGDDTVTEPLIVEISLNNSTWAPLYTHVNTSNTLAWYQNAIDLTAYANSTVYIRWAGVSNYGNYITDFGVDNVLIGDLPAGAPNAVTLNSPADGATGMLQTGFNLTWTPAGTGGTPSYYAVYMSMDPDAIYGDVYFETTGNALNPTTYAGGPSSPITFNYLDRWYWTVEAVNGSGSAVVDPPRWFEIEADPSITIPHTQDFAGAAIPTGWTQTKDGTLTTLNWHISASATAGGTANEMYYNYQSGVGISRLISPPIHTTGIGSFLCDFKHFYDDYGAGITVKLQHSPDLVNWYDTSWSIIGGSGNDTGTKSVLISGLTEPITYLAWVMDGNHFQMDAWYVDDVHLYIPLNWDVAPVSIDMPEVVEPVSMTPKATIINNGLNAATFNVRMDIGTWNNTQNVTIPAGTSQQVLFANYVPAVYTADNVTVTTLLTTDENTANDVITGVLICLPLNVKVYADVAYDPTAVNSGPASFFLNNPGTITDLPAANPWTGFFLAGADWCAPGAGGWKGGEYDDGTLTSDFWWQVDETTGAGTNLGTTVVSLSGVAYDEVNNITYGTDGTSLYTVGPTGTCTLIGALHLTGETSWAGLMIGIAYDSYTSTMYGIDLGYDWLFTINVTTSECTPKPYGLGLALNYAQDCAFDRTNGLLYLAGYTTTGTLYWIDTTNGGAYAIGPFQSGAEMAGFAIPWGGITPPNVVIGTDGTISWTAVDGATGYNIYSADDPYGTYTYVTSTTSLSWLDPAFSEGMKFYVVTADVAALRSSATAINGIQNLKAKPVRLESSTATKERFERVYK